ncbi:hypothetical protein [uncultured Tenacibaculum sp.]|uniref:hypothetical protein n=1 Tax=uncultured Tenacibaculum sp. TaxID=174713 RepID=UPI0026181D16|nr:hypothetical protein [uncultured Tenacibaculum sp.]
MFKNISNLGIVLTKKEQQSIKGAFGQFNNGSIGIAIGNPKQPLSGDTCSLSNLCPTGQLCKCDDDACTSGTCVNT